MGNPNELPCYSMPEPPRDGDLPIPNEVQRIVLFDPSGMFVSQVSEKAFGEEFVYAQRGWARSIRPDGMFKPDDKWLDVWVKNDRGLRITKQREHWNPKIEAVSRKVFQSDPTVGGLEFLMYYRNNLTYWVQTSRVRTSQKGRELGDEFEYGWHQVRYSECKKSF